MCRCPPTCSQAVGSGTLGQGWRWEGGGQRLSKDPGKHCFCKLIEAVTDLHIQATGRACVGTVSPGRTTPDGSHLRGLSVTRGSPSSRPHCGDRTGTTRLAAGSELVRHRADGRRWMIVIPCIPSVNACERTAGLGGALA